MQSEGVTSSSHKGIEQMADEIQPRRSAAEVLGPAEIALVRQASDSKMPQRATTRFIKRGRVCDHSGSPIGFRC